MESRSQRPGHGWTVAERTARLGVPPEAGRSATEVRMEGHLRRHMGNDGVLLTVEAAQEVEDLARVSDRLAQVMST